MKCLFSFLFITAFSFFKLSAQTTICPPNIDFETGTFDHWDFAVGTVTTESGANRINLTPSGPVAGRHEIIDFNTAGFDEFGGFLEACPYGGRYSVKLGNKESGSEAEGISYTFQIPPSADTFSLTYYYAVVFEDPDHDAIEQPRFFVSAYDVETGRIIDCAAYNYISQNTIPGFQRSLVDPNILYKEWTPASIDFAGFSGRTVRLEFKTADCTRGAHFGYAYLDVGTGCGGVMALGAHCVGSDSVVLTAPYGFATYTWYNANYTSVVGTNRLTVLRPAPAASTMYHVDMVPYPGYGCRDTADAEVTILPLPDTPATTDVYYCQGDYARPLKALATGGHELLWYTAATGGNGSAHAPTPSTAAAGIFDYWVSQRSLFGGCEGQRKKMTVTVSPSPHVSFSVNDDSQCQVGNNFIFTNTSTNTAANSEYMWEFGDGDSSFRAIASHSYINPGDYTVVLSVTNLPGCTKTKTGRVYIIEKPVAAFTYPPVICENQTPVLFQNNSYIPGGLSSISNWWWQIGGTVSTNKLPVSFTANAGKLPVKLVVTTIDGCRSDTASDILTIYASPVPKFSFTGAFCNNEVMKIKDESYMPAGAVGNVAKWNWLYDNVPSSTAQHPVTFLPEGPHRIVLQVESDKGCKQGVADSFLIIHPKPSIALHISDSCVFRNIIYTANTTTGVPVSKWWWNFGYGLGEGAPIVNRRFTEEDYHGVTLIGQTAFNCKDTIIRPFTIYYNRSKAEQDTLTAKDQPVQLTTSRAINMAWYKWSPGTGLNSTSIQSPMATYDQDMVYELNTMTVQGCESYSKILVKRYKGPELYVAGAFTPNNFDRLNDTLHVFPVGIKSFGYFSIYNRAGVLLFKTTDYKVGWDGTYKGAYVDPGNYVWVATAIDYKGNAMLRKGNVVLLR